MLVDVDEKKIVLCAQDFPDPSHTAGQEAFGNGRAAGKIVSVFLKLIDEI